MIQYMTNEHGPDISTVYLIVHEKYFLISVLISQIHFNILRERKDVYGQLLVSEMFIVYMMVHYIHIN